MITLLPVLQSLPVHVGSVVPLVVGREAVGVGSVQGVSCMVDDGSHISCEAFGGVTSEGVGTGGKVGRNIEVLMDHSAHSTNSCVVDK